MLKNKNSLLSIATKVNMTDLQSEDSLNVEKDNGSMRLINNRDSNVPLELAAQIGTADTSRKTGDVGIYQYYLGIVGWLNTCVFCMAVAIFTFGLTFPSTYIQFYCHVSADGSPKSGVWVQWWAAANEKQPNHNLALYLGIYSFLSILAELSLFWGC